MTGNDDMKKELAVLSFITTEDGELVSSSRLAEIRKSAHGTFRMMERNTQVRLPRTWARDVDETQRELFARELERRYPELRLCDNHWKADSVAIECLCHFKRQGTMEKPTTGKRKFSTERLDLRDTSNPIGTANSQVDTMLSQENPQPTSKKPKPTPKRPTISVQNPL